ncbi:MAG: putative quinol monooxygenase [Dehalococcoidia bacterium]
MTEVALEELSGLVLVGRAKAHPGKRDDLIALLRGAVALMGPREPGSLLATFHVSPEDPDLVLLYEHYASDEALQEHRANYERFPEYQEIRSRLRSLLVEPLAIERFTPVTRYQQGR